MSGASALAGDHGPDRAVRRRSARTSDRRRGGTGTARLRRSDRRAQCRFDAAWIERRYPAIAGKPWCCSLREIDWRGHGHESRQLGTLLADVAGFFNRRHRADADVAALVTLLTARLPPGHTVAAELFLTAMRPTVRIAATNAPFEVKDRLRQRGYRWDATRRVWSIEVGQEAEQTERRWLADQAGCATPSVTPVTWFTRHRA